jgi:hypothetical protein
MRVSVETGVGAHNRAWSRASAAAITTSSATREGHFSFSGSGGFLGGMSCVPGATSAVTGGFAKGGFRAAHSAAGDGANGGGSQHGFVTAAKVNFAVSSLYLSPHHIPENTAPRGEGWGSLSLS